MKKFLTTLLLVAAVSANAAQAETESMLPSGFLGGWCVVQSDTKTTLPPWNHVAYRAEVVGPCKNVLQIGETTIRQGEDDCQMDDNLRTMLHTQLIRYTCR